MQNELLDSDLVIAKREVGFNSLALAVILIGAVVFAAVGGYDDLERRRGGFAGFEMVMTVKYGVLGIVALIGVIARLRTLQRRDRERRAR